MAEISNKHGHELRNLTIKRVQWNDIASLGFTLTDGQTCKAGSDEFCDSHIFEPSKKITRVECIITEYEREIVQINFYHDGERLVMVGKNDDEVKEHGGDGRKEVFEIAEDEQLIGCELDEASFYGGYGEI